MKHICSLLILILILGIRCNVWDNIYSQSSAQSPIIMSDSINFDFKVTKSEIDVNVDFNAELQTVTITASKMVVLKMEIMKIEVDLHHLIISKTDILNQGCNRYQFNTLKNADIDSTKLGKERLFLINLFFKYVGNTKGFKPLNIYKLEPFIFGKPSQKIKQSIQQNLPDSQFTQELDNVQDIDFDIDFYLCVNPKTGEIEKISTDKDQKNTIPFILKSTLKQRMNCKSDIEQITNEDIKDMAKLMLDSKGDYQNFFN